MPQVFTGTILIPGDKVDAYLAALKEAEEARAPFRHSLDTLNADFAAYLATKYSRRTVSKHTSIVDVFIHFVCAYTDVERLEDVTRGMVNSHFRRWFRRKVLWAMDPDEVRVALRKFFQFLTRRRASTTRGCWRPCANAAGDGSRWAAYVETAHKEVLRPLRHTQPHAQPSAAL